MPHQPSLFDQPQPSQGYSYSTSLPAYHSNKEAKQRQQDYIYNTIKGLIAEGKEVTLLMLEEETGIIQSKVSARIGDLITEGLVNYDGITKYKNRDRKRIVLMVGLHIT